MLMSLTYFEISQEASVTGVKWTKAKNEKRKIQG